VGYYINPTDGSSKEDWLRAHGQWIAATNAAAHMAEVSDTYVVCLVDNGWMTAAAIAYDDRERDVFMRDDGRPKQWFIVRKRELAEFLPPRFR
jgi:hypothetical protein